MYDYLTYIHWWMTTSSPPDHYDITFLKSVFPCLLEFFLINVKSCFHNYFIHTFYDYILYFSPIVLLPDKPTNLTVTNIKSRSAEISWLDPKIRGILGISRFSIKLKKESSLIMSITTGKVNKYEVNNLTPDTTYEISVAAGNYYGFGEETFTSFLTSEGGKC